MPFFQVTKGADAFIDYTTIIEAESAAEAIELASDAGHDWIATGHTPEFDDSTVYDDSAEPITADSLEDAMDWLKRENAPLLTFYIAYTDLNGDSRDLIVQAIEPEGALHLWGDYYFEDEWVSHPGDCLRGVGLEGAITLGSGCGDEDLRIFQINTEPGLPRALKWNTKDLQVVAWVGQS